jgi:hypothetical protein
MYYNEKEYNTTNHYIEDIVKPSNKHFKSNVEFEEELYLLKNETCDPMEHTIKYIARELMDDYENKDCPKTYYFNTGVLIKYRTIQNLDFSIINLIKLHIRLIF